MKIKVKDFMETNHSPIFTVAVVDDHGNFVEHASAVWKHEHIGKELEFYRENIRKNWNKTVQWIGVKEGILTLLVYLYE